MIKKLILTLVFLLLPSLVIAGGDSIPSFASGLGIVNPYDSTLNGYIGAYRFEGGGRTIFKYVKWVSSDTTISRGSVVCYIDTSVASAGMWGVECTVPDTGNNNNLAGIVWDTGPINTNSYIEIIVGGYAPLIRVVGAVDIDTGDWLRPNYPGDTNSTVAIFELESGAKTTDDDGIDTTPHNSRTIKAGQQYTSATPGFIRGYVIGCFPYRQDVDREEYFSYDVKEREHLRIRIRKFE